MTQEPAPSKKLMLDEALLKRFINGELNSALEEKVAQHLEARPNLLQKIAAMSGDAFLERVKAASRRSVSGSHAADSKPPSSQFAANSQAPRLANAAQLNSNAPAKQELAGKAEAASAQPSVPGALARFAGYQIIKELGRGGMGVVYLAKNVPMDRLEVLKVLNERLTEHPGARERFLREIRSVSKLNHQHIVTSYSILPIDDLIVFAMEYVHGMDLHKFLHKVRPMPIGLACSLVRQIALGLQHAHEKGLVHRDVKPSNAIVYKSNGQYLLKILDFGLSKATSEKVTEGLTQDGTMLGTPEYMSPEQTLNAAKADIRADIYSLGCTLYHLLVGRAPFTGTHGEILMAHAHREATPVNLLRPDVPAELAAVVAKMMAKDASKRYQTPADACAALAPFLNHHRAAKAAEVAGGADAANTVNDLRGPERDTSVADSLPNISFGSASQVSQEYKHASALNPPPTARPGATVLSARNRKSKLKRKPPWLLPAIIAGSFTTLLGMLAAVVISLQTPDGTIVLEQIPGDAEVRIDGKRMEVTWNQGRDRAQIEVDEGTHEVKVLSKGLLVRGESVEVKAGETVALKARRIPLTPPLSPSPSTKPLAQADTSADQWQVLFNGQDLTGWKGKPGMWFVEDGCIVGRITAGTPLKANTCLVWQGGDVGDFEIEFEYRLDGGGNSGLQYRSKLVNPEEFIVSGYQADIDADLAYTGYCYEEAGRGILAERGQTVTIDQSGSSKIQASGDAARLASHIRKGDWNRYRIVASGNHIRHYINAELMCQLFDDDNDQTSAAKKGVLALQLHSGRPMTVRFRDVRLKVSPSQRPAPSETSNQISDQPGDADQWIPIFRKGVLHGQPDNSGGANDKWFIANGLLTHSGAFCDRLLLTQTMVRDADIRIEYRLKENAEAALVFRCPSIRGRPRGYAIGLGKTEGATAASEPIEGIVNWWYMSGETRQIAAPNIPRVKADQWHTLEVAVRGSHIEARLDDAKYGEAFDVEHTVGRIGVQARKGIAEIRTLEYRSYDPTQFLRFDELLPTAENEEVQWKYSTDQPDVAWHTETFDDQAWQLGAGGFGNPDGFRGPESAHVRTDWRTSDIWLRKEFELAAIPEGPELRLLHDEDVEVYINGVTVFSQSGFGSRYEQIPLESRFFRPGKNLVAVHCHQTGGGQFIDVGLLELTTDGGSSNVPTAVRSKFETNKESAAATRATGINSTSATDTFVAGSIWTNPQLQLVFQVMERSGDSFRAMFTVGNGIEREIQGTINDRTVVWFPRNVRAIKGGQGGDNFGTLSSDPGGDKIDFVWREGDRNGTFMLRRESKDADSQSIAAPNFRRGNYVKVISGDWHIQEFEGEQTLVQRSTAPSDSIITFGDSGWSDYDLSFKARRESGTQGFKVAARRIGKNDELSLALASYGSSAGDLSNEPNGQSGRDNQLSRALSEDKRIKLDVWYDVKLKVRGSSSKCYLADELIFEVRDDSFTSGRIWLATWESRVRLKDFVVTNTSPEQKILWKGLPDPGGDAK